MVLEVGFKIDLSVIIFELGFIEGILEVCLFGFFLV